MGGAVALMIGGVVLALLLTAAEWVDPEDRDPQARPRRATPADGGWFLVYLAYAPITAAVVASFGAGASRHGLLRWAVERAPWAVQFTLSVVVAELCAYWLHRAMHHVPLLWRVHAVHHGASDVRWWTTFRFHPVDGVLAHGVPILVVAALGFDPKAIGAYLAIVFVVTIFAHAVPDGS
jgi:sterol desaturase/sphingolipid hydroxylase (fatty acid hydroxylase superfamily)